MLDDTIIAVATPPGMGGLGVVRISGRRAVAIGARLFEPKKKTDKPFQARRPAFGFVRDGRRGAVLDEALMTYFPAPHSYTREDVVELSCHGSPAVLEAIIRQGVRAGARPAEPGEFTLRAYLHGRLDILQAEAVNDLVRSASLTQARLSARQLGGSLSRRAWRLRARLIALLSRIEAGLEFPDDGIRRIASLDRRTLDALAAESSKLVASYDIGRLIGEGATLAITGRTNVGKSTLFNALLDEDRAIVTPFPGTTRDFLKEKLVIEDIAFHLVDMAGLGKPSHPVEKTGIVRGQKIAREADALLLVLDGSKKETFEDERLLRKYRGKKLIVVLNKSDLKGRMDIPKIRRWSSGSPVLEVSALKGRNIEGLKRAIRGLFGLGPRRGEDIILHARQRHILERVVEALGRARSLLERREGEELLAEEVRAALSLVGELTGEVPVEEVMADIFGRFCVGK